MQFEDPLCQVQSQTRTGAVLCLAATEVFLEQQSGLVFRNRGAFVADLNVEKAWSITQVQFDGAAGWRVAIGIGKKVTQGDLDQAVIAV